MREKRSEEEDSNDKWQSNKKAYLDLLIDRMTCCDPPILVSCTSKRLRGSSRYLRRADNENIEVAKRELRVRFVGVGSEGSTIGDRLDALLRGRLE